MYILESELPALEVGNPETLWKLAAQVGHRMYMDIIRTPRIYLGTKIETHSEEMGKSGHDAGN